MINVNILASSLPHDFRKTAGLQNTQ